MASQGRQTENWQRSYQCHHADWNNYANIFISPFKIAVNTNISANLKTNYLFEVALALRILNPIHKKEP